MAKEQLFKSYVSTAAAIIQQYDGSTPFHDFLKKYFTLYKKYGSRDRKQIGHLCYCYFRLGKAAIDISPEEKILLALFLCSTTNNEILATLQPVWNEKVHVTLAEKIALLQFPFAVTEIFPWKDELSESINATAFAASHLIQPDLFLSIRPNNIKQVLQKLQEHAISYSLINDSCIALNNATKIENILTLNKEVVVQDHSSQRIAEFFQVIQSQTSNSKRKISAWDCCAASGGKSILAVDTLTNIELTVSDIRNSILQNLKNRFAEAGIKKYTSFVEDLTNSPFTTHNSPFDLIICDAPCTGSGTWGRTPEQLHFFDTKKINEYSTLQKKIVKSVMPCIKEAGWFLYITCSVFKKENEEVVDFILANSNLQLVEKKVLIGYDKKADTMFGALFRK